MRDICKAIIDGNAETIAVATSCIGNLNMVGAQGVEPTHEETATLLRANEDYCRVVRAITHGWVARTPPAEEYKRRKEDKDAKD